MVEYRSAFSIPRDVAYFNVASLAPLLAKAVEAGAQALAQRAAPWTINTPDWFEPVERRRRLFARLCGVPSDNVALVPATSYGLAIAARNITAAPRRRVLVVADDYPSNVYTWRRFCDESGCALITVERKDGRTWTEAILAAADERVCVLAVPNVHWTDGGLIDLVAVAERARELGAKLIVDASQSLGALPLDIAQIRPDYLVAVGYKWLLGPFGLGYLYVADDHLEGRPLEENWISRQRSDDFARLVDYTDRYREGARRFDVGEKSLFEVTPVANVVLETLLEWGERAIVDGLAQRVHAIEGIAERHGLRVTPAPRCSHMIGIQLPPDRLDGVSESLKRFGVHVGVRGASIRVSPHLYTDREDLDRFDAALQELGRTCS